MVLSAIFFMVLSQFTTNSVDYVNGSDYFKKLHIGDNEIVLPNNTFYYVMSDNLKYGFINYELEDEWEITDIKIYSCNNDNLISRYDYALPEAISITNNESIEFGDLRTYIYFFIENKRQDKVGRLYIVIDRFDTLSIDFDTLLLNSSIIEFETPNDIYTMYYADNYLERTNYFNNIQEFSNDVFDYTHCGMLSGNEYEIIGNTIILKISKVAQINKVVVRSENDEKIIFSE